MKYVTQLINSLPEFNGHHEIIRLENTALKVVGFIATHSYRDSSPSLGATRLWSYSTEDEALRDALRLSKVMSQKAVFASLPYGGAKAAFMIPKNFTARKEFFLWYANELNNLNGKFITGSDVGVDESDIVLMHQHTPFVIGHNVPAAYYTSLGVLACIEAVLEKLYGSSDLLGKVFAVQGLGKTGFELVKLLNAGGAKIFACDIDPDKVKYAKSLLPNLSIVDPKSIYTQKVDVFCPCAMNYSINSITEPLLNCLAIVGSANNQMESKRIEEKIYNRGILYAIDYIANDGGLISVVDQYENKTHDDKRIKEKLLSTKEKIKEILSISQSDLISPEIVADRLWVQLLKPKLKP